MDAGIKTFSNGTVQCSDILAAKVAYEAKAGNLAVCFDGKGGLSFCNLITPRCTPLSFYNLRMSVDGAVFDAQTVKTVSMIGRRQTVAFCQGGVSVVLTQFVAKNGTVCFMFEVSSEKDVRFDAVISLSADNASLQGAAGGQVRGKLAKRFAKKLSVQQGKDCTVIKNSPIAGAEVCFAFDCNATVLHTAHKGLADMLSFGCEVKAGRTSVLKYTLGFGMGKYSCPGVEDALSSFYSLLNAETEYETLLLSSVPKAAANETLRALAVSALNCALSNYTEKGTFGAFTAGLNYLSPLRTYFRDGYWTALAALYVKPELVKRQIITLAGGIAADGRCPSAVRADGKPFWGNHYDSPCFFAMLLWDYINVTGDSGILACKVKGRTLLETAQRVTDGLLGQADGTGLIVKSGKYNCRDWADNVFRNGYVTYDEALYARALYSVARLCAASGQPQKADFYKEKYLAVVKSINDLLWSDEKGYFVNYVDGDFTEDNLSVDTVLVVLFDLCNKQRKESVLKNMQLLLESRNNATAAGDFGVLSVYPFYKRADAVVFKSAEEFSYHNGADWPYWSALYAAALWQNGMDYTYALTRWFEFNAEQGRFTPVEYFSPYCACGSALQGWSSVAYFVLCQGKKPFYESKITQK